jgi:hypothetical protein
VFTDQFTTLSELKRALIGLSAFLIQDKFPEGYEDFISEIGLSLAKLIIRTVVKRRRKLNEMKQNVAKQNSTDPLLD